eukprot:395381-Hanusia_phi.AAC.1
MRSSPQSLWQMQVMDSEGRRGIADAAAAATLVTVKTRRERGRRLTSACWSSPPQPRAISPDKSWKP